MPRSTALTGLSAAALACVMAIAGPVPAQTVDDGIAAAGAGEFIG